MKIYLSRYFNDLESTKNEAESDYISLPRKRTFKCNMPMSDYDFVMALLNRRYCNYKLTRFRF